jgi:hypothetical protein
MKLQSTSDRYFNRASKIQGGSATNFAAKFGVLDSAVSECSSGYFVCSMIAFRNFVL